MRISDWSSDVCSSDLLHLFDRGYAGIVLQEDGTANCCLAVHRSLLTEAGSPAALLDRLAARNPALGERLAWRGPAIIDAVANIPYGCRETCGAPGFFRLGDPAAVIPSLAGAGIGMAIDRKSTRLNSSH